MQGRKSKKTREKKYWSRVNVVSVWWNKGELHIQYARSSTHHSVIHNEIICLCMINIEREIVMLRSKRIIRKKNCNLFRKHLVLQVTQVCGVLFSHVHTDLACWQSKSMCPIIMVTWWLVESMNCIDSTMNGVVICISFLDRNYHWTKLEIIAH